MEDKGIEVKSLTDLQLMKASIDISTQLSALNSQYMIILQEFDMRVALGAVKNAHDANPE